MEARQLACVALISCEANTASPEWTSVCRMRSRRIVFIISATTNHLLNRYTTGSTLGCDGSSTRGGRHRSTSGIRTTEISSCSRRCNKRGGRCRSTSGSRKFETSSCSRHCNRRGERCRTTSGSRNIDTSSCSRRCIARKCRSQGGVRGAPLDGGCRQLIVIVFCLTRDIFAFVRQRGPSDEIGESSHEHRSERKLTRLCDFDVDCSMSSDLVPRRADEEDHRVHRQCLHVVFHVELRRDAHVTHHRDAIHDSFVVSPVCQLLAFVGIPTASAIVWVLRLPAEDATLLRHEGMATKRRLHLRTRIRCVPNVRRMDDERCVCVVGGA